MQPGQLSPGADQLWNRGRDTTVSFQALRLGTVPPNYQFSTRQFPSKYRDIVTAALAAMFDHCPYLHPSLILARLRLVDALRSPCESRLRLRSGGWRSGLPR